MSEIYLFWDLEQNELEILGEDGEFYFYHEDNVAINQGDESGRSWTKLNKFRDVTPLNDMDRFLVFYPEINDWVDFPSCPPHFVYEILKHAGDPDWQNL